MPNLVLLNAPGPQGPQGKQGPQGPPGAQGPAGTQLNVSGTGFVHWSGTGADTVARAVNLASSDVTGLLPVADLAPGVNGQFLSTVSGTAVWVGTSSIVAGGVTPGTPGQVYITNSSTVAAWTSLVSVELVHGRFTAGGTGTDFKAVIGPLTAFETTFAGLWLAAAATSPTSANVCLYSDGSTLYVNSPGATSINFVNSGSTIGAAFSWSSSSFYIGGSTVAAPLYVNWSTATAPVIQAGTGATSLTIGMDAPTSDVATGNLVLSPQAPYGTAVTNTTAGNVIVSVPASVGSGAKYGGLQVQYNGTANATIGTYDNNNTSGGALWLGPYAGASVASTNFAILSDSTGAGRAILNSPGGGVLELRSGAVHPYLIIDDTANTLNLATSIASTNVIIGYNSGVGSGSTSIVGNPLVLESYSGGSSIELYCTNIPVDWNGSLGEFVTMADLNNFTFHKSATTAKLWQEAKVADQATNNLTIQAQYAFATATGANRTPGSLIFDVGAPTNSGIIEATINFSRAGSTVVTHKMTGSPSDVFNTSLPTGWQFTWTVDSAEMLLAPTQWVVGGPTAWWISGIGAQVGFGGNSPGGSPVLVDFTTATTPFIQSGSSATSLTIGTNLDGAVLNMQVGTASTKAVLTQTGLQLFSSSLSFGGGSGVLGIANASVAPTTAPSGGFVVYGSSGRMATVDSDGTVRLF